MDCIQFCVVANIAKSFIYFTLICVFLICKMWKAKGVGDERTQKNQLNPVKMFGGQSEKNEEIKKRCQNEEIYLTLPHHKKLASLLMEMIPTACPNYIEHLCIEQEDRPETIQVLIDKIVNDEEYTKRLKNPIQENKHLMLLKEIFPDADSNYLCHQVESLSNNNQQFEEFVERNILNNNYPSIKENDYNYAYVSLKNIYSTLSAKAIDQLLKMKLDVVNTAEALDDKLNNPQFMLKTKRLLLDTTHVIIQNIPLLQEIAFVAHREDIEKFLEDKEKKIRGKKVQAKINNLFCTCNCCYDNEVLPQAFVSCVLGCIFCNECVRQSITILFSEGKLEYPCLGECNSYFNLQTVKLVLNPNLFSKLTQKVQLKEIMAARIEGLESCPFCDFVFIPASCDKIFNCMNPECMKESCRQCKELSHVPLRCEQVEKNDDVRKRTYIENKMTEALLSKCYKCGLLFIKSDGCNKIVCSCGAIMCYVCRQPIQDYRHFYMRGDGQFDLCPLFSDTHELHRNLVLKSAELAKSEIGGLNNPSKLKSDPAADVEEHYEELQLKELQWVRTVCANCYCETLACCSLCRRTPYCSIFCQWADWNEHKVECMQGFYDDFF